MTLQELYDSMSYQFKNISNQVDVTVFTSIANMALKQLSLDVPFNTKTIDIQLLISQKTYDLPADLVMIKQAYDSDANNRPINKSGELLSIFQSSYDKIDVTYPLDGVVLTIVYFASYPTVTLTDEVKIPDTLLSALQYFILFKTITNFTIGQNGQFENYNYMRYKSEIQNYINKNDFTQDEFMKDYNSFEAKGWI